MKKGHLGVFSSHNTTVQHHWHGSNFKLCSARPHGITRVEGSARCLPDARYARYRGREEAHNPIVVA